MLEAEGCEVLLLRALPLSYDSMNGFDCIIVDDNALINKEKTVNRLRVLRPPVILLADHSEEFLISESLWVIEKPTLGLKLVEAVRSVLRPSPELRSQLYFT